MNRGERIAGRTKPSIKKALLELMREKNYPDITVSEITERGNVGRSTLYKHYKSKADVLLDIHTDIFQQLFAPFSNREAWFASEPPDTLVEFFEKFRKLGRNPFALSYKLGSDLDYLITSINHQLTATVEEKLRHSFQDNELTISPSILALSVSSLYSGLMMAWFTRFQSSDPHRFATTIHRMTRALIAEAT